jgi:hypothetical protein
MNRISQNSTEIDNSAVIALAGIWRAVVARS